MIGAFVMVAVISLIAGIEISKLRRSQSKQAIMVYLALMSLGDAAIVVRGLGKALPNPSDWITMVLAPLNQLLLRLGVIQV